MLDLLLRWNRKKYFRTNVAAVKKIWYWQRLKGLRDTNWLKMFSFIGITSECQNGFVLYKLKIGMIKLKFCWNEPSWKKEERDFDFN